MSRYQPEQMEQLLATIKTKETELRALVTQLRTVCTHLNEDGSSAWLGGTMSFSHCLLCGELK